MIPNLDNRPVELTRQELLEKMPTSVVAIAQEMLASPNLLEKVIDDVAVCGVARERDLIASVYLVGTSRQLNEPLAAIVQSPTSTGKSYVVEKTSALFPPEAVVLATAITPQALYYMPPGSLSNKFVVAGERSRYHDDQSADGTRALRELISGGQISKLVTDTSGGQPIARRVEQSGPIAYIESTTAPDIFAEDANRCLILTTDDSPQQTRAILIRMAAGSNGAHKAIVQKHHAIQRMLQPRPVKVPFGGKLAELFPADRSEARRAFGQLLRTVRAAALLHQFQRSTDEDGCIIATVADYEVARRLLEKPLGRSLGSQISGGAIRFHRRVFDAFGNKVFTTTDVVRRVNMSRQTVGDYLLELSGVGAVTQHDKGIGCKPATWHIDAAEWTDPTSRALVLPSASDC